MSKFLPRSVRLFQSRSTSVRTNLQTNLKDLSQEFSFARGTVLPGGTGMSRWILRAHSQTSTISRRQAPFPTYETLSGPPPSAHPHKIITSWRSCIWHRLPRIFALPPDSRLDSMRAAIQSHRTNPCCSASRQAVATWSPSPRKRSRQSSRTPRRTPQ